MQLVNHGGHCCGVKHLWGFSDPMGTQYDNGRKKRKLTIFNQLAKQFKSTGTYAHQYGRDGGTRGKLIEVILTDIQVTTYPKWVQRLKEEGFRLVTRFHNSSGGWCNVFHLTTQQCGDEAVPEWWSALDKKEDSERGNEGAAPNDEGVS